MIVGEICCLPVPGHVQGGGDRAPCRREYGAGEEDERVSRGWGREPRQQRPHQASSHPGEQKGCRIGQTPHDGSPRQACLGEQPRVCRGARER